MKRTVSTTPVVLKNHVTRGMHSLQGPAVFILLFMGIIFTLAGTGVMIAMNLTPSEIPAAIKYMFGPIFAFAGIGMLGMANRLWRIQSGNKKRREEFAAQPWRADYPWNVQGTTVETHWVVSALGICFVWLFLSMFNWFVFVPNQVQAGEVPLFARVIVGILDVVALAMVAFAVRAACRHIRYGKTHLAFERCPFVLGQTLNVQFTTARPINKFNTIRFTLRCVQEVTSKFDGADGEESRIESTQVYAETLLIDEPGESNGSGSMPLSFELPNSPELTTSMLGEPVRYWELSIHADTPGLNFDALFLVPVYSNEDAGLAH